MSFLSPLVLGGLAAVGVPIIIHLLNKFRVLTTDWGAMRFLTDIVQKNQRRIKLDDLLLLLLRCLLVILAVFAFARPALKGLGLRGESDAPVAAVILLDNSASMAQTGGSLNRFDLAKGEIRDWLSKQSSRTVAALYLVSSRTTPLVGKPESDFGLFRKYLDDAQVSDHGSDLVQGIRLAIETLKPVTGRPKEIRIYTDGQATAIRSHEELKKLALENPDIVIKPILVGEKGEENLGIVGLNPEGGIASVGQPCRFRIEVMNSGASAIRNVKVDLVLNGSSPAGSGIIPVIGSGETQGINIPVSFADPGPQRITATLPVDAFPTDNQRAAAVDAINHMDVVIAQAEIVGEPVEQGGFFIAQALVPVAPDQVSRYYLAPQFVRPADLPSSLSLPPGQRPSVVFLCDPGPLTAAVVTALESYVTQGGNLAIFPGENSDVKAWETDSVLSKLLPATLAPAGEPSSDQAAQSWQPKGFTHPITTLWNDSSNGSLGSVRFLRHFPMTLKTTGSPNVVAAFVGDGQPSVAEWKFGEGTVVLFNASTTPGWSNFPLHPSFVPFLQRLMGYLNRSNETRLTLAPGEAFRKPVAESLQGKDFSVLRPGTDAARTAGQVTGDSSGTFVRYSATERTGAYQLYIGSEPVASFAVQMDPSESDLRTVNADVFEELVDVPHSTSGESAGVVILKEYWAALIWCVFAVSVAEAALAHRNSFAR